MKSKTKRKSGGSTLGFLTRDELSKEIGLSKRTIARMTSGESTPRLPCIRIGRLIRYQREAVIKALTDAETVNASDHPTAS